VRAGNGAHALGGRLIVEENAAAAIDLQVNEARGKERAGWQARLRPIGGNLAPGPNSNHTPVPDRHRSFDMPVATVKNAVCQEGMPSGD
jgi:hypothetical protein